MLIMNKINILIINMKLFSLYEYSFLAKIHRDRIKAYWFMLSCPVSPNSVNISPSMVKLIMYFKGIHV